jgi:hypothetical protein
LAQTLKKSKTSCSRDDPGEKKEKRRLSLDSNPDPLLKYAKILAIGR